MQQSTPAGFHIRQQSLWLVWVIIAEKKMTLFVGRGVGGGVGGWGGGVGVGGGGGVVTKVMTAHLHIKGMLV